MANLVSAYGNQRRWKKAEELQVHVMEARKRDFGQEHRVTLSGVPNLASVYTNQGRLKEAKELDVTVIATR